MAGRERVNTTKKRKRRDIPIAPMQPKPQTPQKKHEQSKDSSLSNHPAWRWPLETSRVASHTYGKSVRLESLLSGPSLPVISRSKLRRRQTRGLSQLHRPRSKRGGRTGKKGWKEEGGNSITILTTVSVQADKLAGDGDAVAATQSEHGPKELARVEGGKNFSRGRTDWVEVLPRQKGGCSAGSGAI